MIAGSTAISRSPPVSATKTRGPTARRGNSTSSIWKCRLSRRKTFSRWLKSFSTGCLPNFPERTVAPSPFQRIPYREAMVKYGTDKPDLRVSHRNPRRVGAVLGVGVQRVSKTSSSEGGVVRAIPVKAISDRPRNFFDKLVDYATSIGAKGLAYLVWSGNRSKGPHRQISQTRPSSTRSRKPCDVENGDVVFFMCDIGREPQTELPAIYA